MKKKIYNKLATKLIFLVVLALLISLLFSSGLLTIFGYIMKSNSYVSLYDVPNYYIYIIVFFMTPIITFVAAFLFGINKRIKYLKYIISKVGSITNENFIEKLEFKGNDEISDLAKSINIMSDRLKENYEKKKNIEKDKNELIVAVSHDLRTPLTSIIGYLELLKDDKFPYEDCRRIIKCSL